MAVEDRSKTDNPMSGISKVMSSFRFIDLFCGIGGFHRALSDLGGTCVFASDIDTKCQDVYERNFRLRPVGDICAVRSEDVPDHDVLCGGFPCQPFSTAGHREAFDDTRGTLFQEIARIVRDKKPKVLLLENVKGIKNIQGGHVYRVILGVFESLGYTVKDVVLSPDMFGVPQRRERVYFIGIRNDLGVATLPPLPTKTPCTVLDTSVDSTYRIAPELRSVFSAWDEMIPVLAGTTVGVPILLDYFTADETAPGTQAWKRTYILKNKAVYAAHKDAWDTWMARHDTLLKKKAVYRKLEWQAGKMKREDTVLNGHFIQMRQSGIRIKNATTFPTLVAIVQTSIVGSAGRYITPRECARLQSFPDSHILHEQDRIAYKQLGNSVNVNVVHHVARHALSLAGLTE
jgi:DNA (cytosine-5)-methyltransferase 1